MVIVTHFLLHQYDEVGIFAATVNLFLFVIHIAFRSVGFSITGAQIREVLLYKSTSFVSTLPRIVYFSHTFMSFLYYFCILYLIAYIFCIKIDIFEDFKSKIFCILLYLTLSHMKMIMTIKLLFLLLTLEQQKQALSVYCSQASFGAFYAAKEVHRSDETFFSILNTHEKVQVTWNCHTLIVENIATVKKLASIWFLTLFYSIFIGIHLK